MLQSMLPIPLGWMIKNFETSTAQPMVLCGLSRRHGHRAAGVSARRSALKERCPHDPRKAPQPHGKDEVEITPHERQLEPLALALALPTARSRGAEEAHRRLRQRRDKQLL
jgi:hypothetical protein